MLRPIQVTAPVVLAHRQAPWRVPGGFLGALPNSTVRPFKGPKDTLQQMAEHALGPNGEQSMLVRQFTEWALREVYPKDYLGEIIAIRNVFVQWSPFKAHTPLFRYSNDPRHVEMVKTPERLVREIQQFGSALCDCFPEGTLLLRDDYELVPIEQIQPGMRIWGYDRWSTVHAKQYKGLLSTDAVKLNNGSTMRLTGDHHLLVIVCKEHRDPERCTCPVEQCEMQRISVSELLPGMRLVAPSRIPFGSDEMDAGRAYVEGLYVSDGWSSSNSEFSISGQDGCPKEAQKREVETLCARLGVRTRWQRKSLAVLDGEWTLRIHLMGGHAPEKRLLSLNLAEAQAAQTLRGIMADSGANSNGRGRTFTTTSYKLAVQARVLWRMFGKTCGYSYIEKHGGLGKNPIWRLNVRSGNEEHVPPELSMRGPSAGVPALRVPKVLRVDDIERDVVTESCWDIETDDHHVYLPEHDVTVQNCDDMAQMAATMAMQIGREVELVALGFAPGSLSHVGVRVKEPKSSQWIWLDGVAGPREREAAATAKELLVLSLN